MNFVHSSYLSGHELVELEEEKKVNLDIPSIPEFYKDQEIFVTGGSGFMGKVLIEKLLRSCPGIKCIYILIRPKKGKSIEERIKALTELPIFAPLKNSKPEMLKKMIGIPGDVTKLCLGISKEDLKRMENVSIIFHSAASVRFDDTLKYALLMNTRGTQEVIKIAENLKNIKVLMHVSTTYCNPDRHVIDEKIYPPYVDWRKSIKIAETIDEDVLNVLTPKYTTFMPNTYTFTKSLSEQILLEYKDKLPIVLFRPSIVISSMKDPFAGWIDNFNGPVGLLVGCGIGITRTMYCSPDNIADFTPVDVCIKAMIISAWKRAFEPRGNLPVYNCCTSNHRNMTMEQIVEMGRELSHEIPLGKMLWAPGGQISQNRIINFIKVIILHILPAMIIDKIFKYAGQKPFLTNLQRKVYMANCALEYFILNNWDFKNHNFMELCSYLRDEDNKAFYYKDFTEFDMRLYFKSCILGSRRYLLGEKDEDLPKGRDQYNRLKILDKVVKTIIYGTFFYLLFFRYDIINVSKQYFRELMPKVVDYFVIELD